ncbi:MAG: polysaccharide deacetylase family protein, partial [Candidatus Margulisbacteria bacterium]|nr:polysaccharide deacetylase family protein [Candidatus Margulisiibacteriota bacterium]
GKKVVAKPEVLDALVASGQEIGNHTYYHSRLNWVTERKMLDEIKLTSDIISGYTNGRVKPTLFRPPHGFLPRSKSLAIQKAGYTVVMWSVNGDDFYHSKTGMRSPVSIAERVLARINGGDIILLHDISQQTVDALPYIIRPLKKKGFKFVTISELMRQSGRYALALKKTPTGTEEIKSVIVLRMETIKPESSYYESQDFGLPLPGPEDRSAIQKWPRQLFGR